MLCCPADQKHVKIGGRGKTMAVEFTVISIGALSHNHLWGESVPVRTAHATTTYVVADQRRILVDPSLPAVALAARFNERTGQSLADVTDVFCTSLRAVHRRSIEALDGAAWWASELELQTCHRQLVQDLQAADQLDQPDAAAARADLKLLEKFSPAPDRFSPQVSLFPTPGPSAGAAGLLLTPPAMTVAIAGDAAITTGHVAAGQVWRGCEDRDAAMESFRELIEIADVLVTGHDNMMLTPHRNWL